MVFHVALIAHENGTLVAGARAGAVGPGSTAKGTAGTVRKAEATSKYQK